MTAGAEQIGDRAMGGEKALGMAGGLEPAHRSLALSGWLVGQFSAVIQALVLAVLNAWHQLFAGCFVALELIGDDDPRDVTQAFEELAEKAFGGTLVAARLNQDVQHITVLIDLSPEVVASAIDAEIDLVQMPLVAASGRTTA